MRPGPNLSLYPAALALVLSGCIPGEPQQGADGSAPVPPEVRRQADLACQDAASRLGIDPRSIHVQEARRVTWPSGASGCPQPGTSYTQALVPGVLIVLRAGGQTYRYHASGDGEPFHCPQDRAQPPIAGEGAAEKL
ncbi:MAG TPA: hypothetical protein VFG48_07555 [Xanthomonadales bacterium]|nr:hypothetical protein [Xanthomonadales bacterium]